MDELNSLESSLPPEQAPTEQAINALKAELSNEFKIAANAVTKLYRVSNEKNSLMKHSGYVNCLDDLLREITSSNLQNINDVHLWCLAKRNEKLLVSNNNNDNKTNINDHKTSNNNINNFISTTDFDFNNTCTKSNLDKNIFRESLPPLSVEQSPHTVNTLLERRKRIQDIKAKDNITTANRDTNDSTNSIGNTHRNTKDNVGTRIDNPLIHDNKHKNDNYYSSIKKKTKKQKKSKD